MKNNFQHNLVMYAIAYMTLINYGIIVLFLLYELGTIQNQIHILLIYLAGAVVSAITSSFVIQKAKQNLIDIKKAIIFLALCHMPALATLVVAMIMI
jgi:hypothetical protein